jgi:hypothetical protein
MRLAELQSAFMASLLDSDQTMPADWSERHAAGLNIYRGNYRNALVEALRDTFAKTQAWVGEAPFKQAAINHVITRPSASWTIDDVGEGFDETCAEFFKQSPEVAELAWLEWSMLTASSAADTQSLDLEAFGLRTSDFGEEEWMRLTLELVPNLTARIVQFDLTAIWRWAENPEGARPDAKLQEPTGVMVWREGERTTFQLVATDEVQVFEAVQAGKNYGAICVMLAGDDPGADRLQETAMRSGAILGRWVQEGLVTSLKT